MAENTLEISGNADNKEYSSKFNLYKEINPDESKYQITGFQVKIILSKKDKETDYWPYLVREKKLNNISVDWNKYIDEDEEFEQADKGLNDWDPEMMNCTFIIRI